MRVLDLVSDQGTSKGDYQGPSTANDKVAYPKTLRQKCPLEIELVCM